MIQFLISSMKKRFLILILLLTFWALSSCGIYKPVDAREIPPEADKRVQKNIEEGKGIKLGSSLFGDGANTFQFATSNPLWRASLEILDFLPLLLFILIRKFMRWMEKPLTIPSASRWEL